MKPNRNSSYQPELEILDQQEELEVRCDEQSSEFDSNHFSFRDQVRPETGVSATLMWQGRAVNMSCGGIGRRYPKFKYRA